MTTKETHATKAQAIEHFGKRLAEADSIAEDIPELRKLFHEARTSRRNA